MDLGIAGRKAIVCASSKGLGRACAQALAEAGCAIVLNGRDAEALARTGRELREATGVKIREILGDLDDPATRAELIAACPDADILVNNNGGPPRQAFDQISRDEYPHGPRVEHADPDRAHSGACARHGGTQVRPDRQYHLEFSQGAGSPASTSHRARARADRLPCLGGAAFRGQQRYHQLDPARIIRHRPAEGGSGPAAATRSVSVESARTESKARIPAGRFGDPAEFGSLCAFLAGAQAGFITGQNILIDGGAFPGAF